MYCDEGDDQLASVFINAHMLLGLHVTWFIPPQTCFKVRSDFELLTSFKVCMDFEVGICQTMLGNICEIY